MPTSEFDRIKDLRERGCFEEAAWVSHLAAEQATDINEKVSLLLSEHTCYCILGDLRKAAEILERISTLKPTDLEVRLNFDFAEATFLVQAGESTKGLQKLSAMIDNHVAVLNTSRLRYLYEDIQLRRGETLAALSRFDDALPLLNECLSFKFDNKEDEQRLRLALAICYGGVRDTALAKNEYLRVIGFGLRNGLECQARYRLAVLFFDNHAFAQAKNQLEALLPEYPKSLPDVPGKYVYGLLSRVCHFLGEADQSKEYARIARSL